MKTGAGLPSPCDFQGGQTPFVVNTYILVRFHALMLTEHMRNPLQRWDKAACHYNQDFAGDTKTLSQEQ